jgi:RNA polymerase-binding transcription factor DksA
METIRAERHVDQLRRRREQIAMTLRHLGKERAEVEGNTEWVNRAAYEKRARLLSRVRGWYVTEIEQIDKALTRVKKRNYGVCAACNGIIEERLLEIAPESEFCNPCQVGKNLDTEF